MRIVPIFEGLLYSFQPESEDVSEFQKFFEFLQDQEQLFNFLKENKADLKRPYSVSSALQQIRGDFTRMFRELQRKASENDLTTLFRHIQSSNIKGELYSREKYRYQRSWLRMYAIRLEGDIFIVSGGAIKLTQFMEERKHTQIELSKLNRYRDWCVQENLLDIDALRDYNDEH